MILNVPDFKSKKYIKKSKIKDLSWTRFYFPFNNPKKPAEMAYKETLNGFNTLNVCKDINNHQVGEETMVSPLLKGCMFQAVLSTL